ncbi:tetratricopeptide repeat protein [Thermodesulfobacteriota bacterium]
MSSKYKLASFVSVILVIVLILLFIQNRYQRKEMPAVEQDSSQDINSDQEAFYGAYRIREPEKKLEALEKFIMDFPDSSYIGSAKREMFKATVKVWPGDREKLFAAADRVTAPADKPGKQMRGNFYNYQFVARELLSAGIFLDDAERFASKSLELLEKRQFIEYEKKQYVEWGEDIPSDDEMDEKYIKELAAYSTTLGRIYLEKGRTAEGEKILQDAYDVDPAIAQAAIGLAEIAESRGDNTRAMDLLTAAIFTAGSALEDARERTEALYRKTHNGSLDGLEALLDTVHKRLFPNPVNVDKYLPDPSRSERTVLAEFFTGAG